MNNKNKALIVVVVLLAVVAVIGIFSYLIGEEKDAKSEFSDNFTPEVKWKVHQIGNNSALLHLVIELPPDKKNLKAKVISVEDSFSHDCRDNLYLGTYENLSFVQCEDGLENHLIVPSGKRLTVKVKLSLMIDENKSWWTTNIEDTTIEVIT